MSKKDADPNIIIKEVQALVYQVADIDAGKSHMRRTTIHGSNIPNQPIIALNLKVFICIISSYAPLVINPSNPAFLSLVTRFLAFCSLENAPT